MTVAAGFAYAQGRIQSRYGDRADSTVWLRLDTIHNLGGYLQAAQQTPLRPWILGINANHHSHDIELALRQKHRHHIDEVASWLPPAWRVPLRWINRLADLPALQYLMAGDEALTWMRSDPDIRAFTADDPTTRMQAMRSAGCGDLVDAWQQEQSLVTAWLSHWHGIWPRSRPFEPGLTRLEQAIQRQSSLNAHPREPTSPSDYDALNDELRAIFRRHAFQPAGVCAYLAMIAIDLHRLRGSLMLRLLFPDRHERAEGLST